MVCGLPSGKSLRVDCVPSTVSLPAVTYAAQCAQLASLSCVTTVHVEPYQYFLTYITMDPEAELVYTIVAYRYFLDID